MEFFDWMGIPQVILEYFYPSSTLWEYINNQLLMMKISLIVAAGLFLVGTIFCGVGLYTIAKRAGIKHGWLGFLPIVNTLYVGKIAGECNFFGKRSKHIGLYATIAEVCYILINAFTIVLFFLHTNINYYTLEVSEAGETYAAFHPELMPENLRWVAGASLPVNIVGYVVYFAAIVVMWSLYSGFFRKYYARSPMMMAFLCTILPVRGFVIFAVRNNSPVDYNEYMRKRMQAYMAQQQQYANPGAPASANDGQAQHSPFSDFGDPPDSNTNENSAPHDGNSEPPADDPFPDF